MKTSNTFIVNKVNLVASLNLLETMCHEAVGEADLALDGRNAQPTWSNLVT